MENDKLRSTRYRVANVTGNAMRRSRYSAVLFYDPHQHIMPSCQSTCQNPGYRPRYASIQTGDYRQSQLAAIYRSTECMHGVDPQDG